MLTLKSVLTSAAATACAAILLSTTACTTVSETMGPAKVNCYIGNNAPIMLTPEECSARGGNTTRG